MLSLDIIGYGLLILAALLLLHFFYHEWRFDKHAKRLKAAEDALEVLDEHNLQYINHLAALANHHGLKYPPTEKITPAKTIPEKHTIVWEKLRK